MRTLGDDLLEECELHIDTLDIAFGMVSEIVAGLKRQFRC